MKKALVGLAVLLVLLLVAVLVAPRFVPVDAYRSRLVALVKQSTGRDLKINGPLSLSLVPHLALSAEDVAFANAPGGQAVNMAQLKSLEIELKLLPLLHGTLAVDRFILVEPVIALEVDKAGHPNWVFAHSAAGAATASPAPAASPARESAPGAGLSQLRLDDVELSNGTISFANLQTGKQVSVTGITMKVSLPDLESPCTVEGSAVWNAEPVTFAVALAKPGALERGEPSGVTVKLQAKPVTFTFDGTVTGAAVDRIEGAIDLSVPSVRDLAKWAGYPLTVGGNGFGPLAIKGKIAASGSSFTFSDAGIAFDAIKSRGDLTVDTGGARPVAQGRLAVDQLDLNPYLAPAGAATKPAAGTAASEHGGAGGWSDEPLDVAGLKAVDADLTLNAGGIKYRKVVLGKSALALQLKDGRLAADLSEIALYQGSGHGKLTVDGGGAVPALQANFSLAHVQIGPLLNDTLGMDKLSGTGSFDLAISGRGRSERELIGSLDGRGAINLVKGAYRGANLAGLIKSTAAPIVGGRESGEQTDIASLLATYVIANGVVRNNDLKLVSADLPMEGAGTIDLPRQRVDYKVTPRLAGAIAVPVLITGPWDQLSYQPDVVGIVTDPAKTVGGLVGAGAKGVGGTVKDVANPLGGALKGLLGQ